MPSCSTVGFGVVKLGFRAYDLGFELRVLLWGSGFGKCTGSSATPTPAAAATTAPASIVSTSTTICREDQQSSKATPAVVKIAIRRTVDTNKIWSSDDSSSDNVPRVNIMLKLDLGRVSMGF